MKLSDGGVECKLSLHQPSHIVEIWTQKPGDSYGRILIQKVIGNRSLRESDCDPCKLRDSAKAGFGSSLRLKIIDFILLLSMLYFSGKVLYFYSGFEYC